MSRWLPHPRLSLVLFLLWLLLAVSVSPGQLLLAAAFAIAIPHFTRPIAPRPFRLGRPGLMARLALVVLWDIVVSNVEVAVRILGPESAIRPRFVWIPLDIRDPAGASTLAGIVTMTPGTVSCDITPGLDFLLVHAFDAPDEAVLAARIKARYEAPLMEIFR
jgi:multicomponent K+:H+ antiporter subunit E